jgi:subtilisin family serine protease/subtilase family serine protease
MRRALFGVPVAFGVVAVLLLTPTDSDAQRSARLEQQTVNGRAAVAREVLVRFRNPIDAAVVAGLVPEADADDVEQVHRAGILRVRSRSLSAAALVDRLRQRRDVVYAEPNFIIQLQGVPNDPYFPYLWGLESIQAPAAWDLSTGSTSHVVAVIDTGIDYTHPDVAPNMWAAPTAFTVEIDGQQVTCAAGSHGFNAITGSCDPMDDHNHGTHVAGTIGAVGANGIGVAGVSWTTRLLAIKFFDSTGTGTVADAIRSIEFARAVKEAFAISGGADVRVLSNSWGMPEYSQALYDAIALAGADDMLVVAGAGNDGADTDITPFYPASYDAPNVVSVAATTLTGGPASFSNRGAVSVDLSAPGDFILSTTIGGTYGLSSGTSMATPHVSGAAALVLSRCALNTAALKDALLGTVSPVAALAGLTVTGGSLNVNSALHACISIPAAPADLTARGADGVVTLTWPAVLGAIRYNVKRSLTPGGPYAPLASAVQGTSYADTGVTNGTTYYYVVSAENMLGEGADSIEASATPDIPPDLVVSAFTAPGFGGADSTIDVSFTVTNQGDGHAALSTARFFLSINPTLDPTDTPIGDHQVPGLPPAGAASSQATLSIPAGMATGLRYLIAVADADDVLDESEEENNDALRLIQIGPDLIVQTFTAPAAVTPGETLVVSDTIRNRGGGAAGGSITTFYFSEDRYVGAGDVSLGSRAVAALPAGTTDSGDTTVTIPSTASFGLYYLLATTDDGGTVDETYENNNTYARQVQIGGDLVFTSFTVPATAAPGSTVVVDDTIRNQGSVSVAASVTRFHLSVNAVLDAGDTPLAGGRSVPPLQAGVSSSGSTTLAIPAATASGKYYVIAQADADGAVPETYETNNTLARVITIGNSLNVDLIVSALTVPGEAGAGTPITVTDTTANPGADDAPASVTEFYLSANIGLDPGDVSIGAREVPALAAGAAHTGSTTLTVPSALGAGTYYVIAKADAGNAVGENNENNNTLPRLIRIGGDLIVSALTVPAEGGAGVSLVLTETTTNQGSGSIGPTTTGFYLSTNGVYDALDMPLGSRPAPQLTPGSGHSASTTVTLPATVDAGVYYVIARADAGAAEVETQEANNTLARIIRIGSDLWVSGLAGPTSAAAGTDIVLTDTTANKGGGAAAASTTRFFLSADWSLSADDEPLGSRVVPALAVDASSTGSTTVTIPAGTAAARFYLIALADADETVPETFETNNVRVRAIQVTAP